MSTVSMMPMTAASTGESFRPEAMRAELPDTSLLAMTALASWAMGDAWLEGLPVDAAVPMAFEQVGCAQAALDMANAYAKERFAFGRPIGSFQAIKHRLADAFLAVERASALAYFATLTVAEDDPRRTVAVSMAKSAAGDCQRLLTRDGLQLHGGVGYTWEHDLHLWLKRAAMSELVFGTSAWHRARLARAMGLVAEEAR